MKLGFLTDIHEHVEHLRVALDQFRIEGIDQVVVIGDLFEQGRRIEETCRLLAEASAVGVWGNHDFGRAIFRNWRTKHLPTAERLIRQFRKIAHPTPRSQSIGRTSRRSCRSAAGFPSRRFPNTTPRVCSRWSESSASGYSARRRDSHGVL